MVPDLPILLLHEVLDLFIRLPLFFDEHLRRFNCVIETDGELIPQTFVNIDRFIGLVSYRRYICYL